jgi:hypothetical protein
MPRWQKFFRQSLRGTVLEHFTMQPMLGPKGAQEVLLHVASFAAHYSSDKFTSDFARFISDFVSFPMPSKFVPSKPDDNTLGLKSLECSLELS